MGKRVVTISLDDFFKDCFSRKQLENAKVEDFIMRFSASRGFMFERVVVEVAAVKEDQVSMFDGLI
jgi:hypothetical protein